MFDEVSEGTQIVKVTNNPPTQSPYAIAYEGMPSDAYLCFTSQGSQMLKGKVPSSTPLPNCPGMTQPTIPDPVAPLDGDTESGPMVNLSWTAAMALAGGGNLTTYDTWLDGTVQSTSSLAPSATTSLSVGTHVWRVRAVNSLGNAGGWSIAQTFAVTSSSGDSGGGSGPEDAAAASDGGSQASSSPDASASGGGTNDASAPGATASGARSSGGCSCTESSRRGAASDGIVWTFLGWALAFARRRERR